MSYPKVYIYEAQDEWLSTIVAIVSMNEEHALKQVESRFGLGYVFYLLKTIEVDTITDEVIEIYIGE